VSNTTDVLAASAADTSSSTWPPEQAVLGHLLDAHPRRLARSDLEVELAPRVAPAAIDRAAGNLAKAGLIEVADGALVPARAVLDFDAIDRSWQREAR